MADKVIQIPNVGNVAFPGEMTDEQIAEAINKNPTSFGLQTPGVEPGQQPPQAPPNTGTDIRSLLGRLANIATGAYGGAQLGSPAGPWGAGIGAVAGGGLSALLPPTEHPGMETAATAANAALDVALPGAGSASRLARLLRGGAMLAGTAGAGLAGSLLDQTDTPYGEVALFSGLSAAPEIAKALTATKFGLSKVGQAAERLGGFPLTPAEATGAPKKLEEIFMGGSAAAKDLAAQQTARAQAIIGEIMNAPLSKSLDVIQAGIGAKQAGRRSVRAWVDAWYADPKNKITTTVATPSNPLTGTPSGTMAKTTVKPPDWTQFEQAVGLDKLAAKMGVPTKDLRDDFFRTLRVDPEQVVNQFLPGPKNQVKGLLKLRSVLTVLDNSGKDVEAGRLGQAVVMQYLGPVFKGEVTNGKQAAQLIDNAISEGTQPGMLQVVLDSKRIAALKDLATVLRESNPIEKVGAKVSEAQRTGGYLYHKLAFGAASGMAGVGGEGYREGVMPSPLVFALGAFGGAGSVILGSTVLGKIMANPDTSKTLVRASRGSAAAATAFIRSLVSADWSGENEETKPEEQSRARLSGLFRRP